MFAFGEAGAACDAPAVVVVHPLRAFVVADNDVVTNVPGRWKQGWRAIAHCGQKRLPIPRVYRLCDS